ncbi:MAG: efflux RND transporter periplasmic adaptor subunit [Candidatus Giovannonibacteria bacterium]|nr:MAG: efflux RND transporter periplasmic adaptor subunit [Candidatus Giovannonibacteria bacterium]
MRNFFKKIAKKKLWAGIAALALMIAGYFSYQYFFGKDEAVRYLTAEVRRGTLEVSVNGSGQVSASNQLGVKSKVSGDAVYVAPVEGREVGAGALIVQLDARDAQKAVRDAEVNLESAKLALEKLRGPAESDIPRNKRNAQDDLKRAYDDGFTAVSNAFLDLPAAITGLKDLLFGINFSGGQSNMNYYADAVKNYDTRSLDYRDSANTNYQKARAYYDKNFDDYRMTGREAERAEIEALIDETYGTAISLSDAVKSANNLIQFYKDRLTERDLKPNSLADTHLAQLDAYTDKTNTHIAALLNMKNQIKNYKDAVSNADLDVKTQELAVRQRENGLLDAKEKLADYYIRAPFAGVVAEINVKKGDAVSPSLVAATLITRQKIAEISLNEVDAAGVKIGNKAFLTFDALPDVKISGEVAEVDTLGAINQGVVTYGVKVIFETDDERVKTGMSASADIVVNTKAAALLAPNSAVKSSGSQKYIEVLSDGEPRRINVETGLASEELTEILSGVNEGDEIITRTISPANQTQQAPSIFGPPGGARR